MKLMIFSGGLGNQMFQYSFFLELQKIYPKVFVDFKKIHHYGEHNGYELGNVFGVHFSPNQWLVSRFLLIPLLGNLLKDLLFRTKYRERDFYHFGPYAFLRNPAETAGSARLSGYWQSERFFEHSEPEVRKAFAFPIKKLNEKSRKIWEGMGEQSVSLHVRRGDYTLSANVPRFGGICTIDYYKRAIAYFRAKLENPTFYVFSNDMDWCRANLAQDGRFFFVDCNQKDESWQDLFLMSRCAHNIIANSSFSWWGAWLNSNSSKLVVAPERWCNDLSAPDAVPPKWIRL